MLWIGVISLFPEIFHALQVGITGKAIQNKLLHIEHWSPRQFASNQRRTIDRPPYGGGPGMIMMAEPLQAAIQAAKQKAPHPPTTIYLSPQGQQYHQTIAHQFATRNALILLAGRYEGIDERIITHFVDEEWSIGDYILSGGELAALVLIDTIARLLPGAIHDPYSVSEDSITSKLLKYPQYTHPQQFQQHSVPAVLLSGHHQKIAQWRLQQSLGKTWLRRPDLFKKKTLNPCERILLAQFIDQFLKNTN